MKKIWISAVTDDEKLVGGLSGKLGEYGLVASGHYWEEDLSKRAWLGPREKCQDHDLWLILCPEAALDSAANRFGLSLAALSVQAARGHGFPLVLAWQGKPPEADHLPTPLRGADLLKLDDPALGARITALSHTPAKKIAVQYRLDLHPLPHGLCFEVGPAGQAWEGVLFGVTGNQAAISVQAVGPAGQMPERSTLQYPMRDIKLQMGEKEYVAWALRNTIDEGSSYYALVQGEPEAILFGPFAADEAQETEFFSIQLK